MAFLLLHNYTDFIQNRKAYVKEILERIIEV